MNPLALVVAVLAFCSAYSHSHHNRQENEHSSTKSLRELMVKLPTPKEAPKDPSGKLSPKLPSPEEPSPLPPKSKLPEKDGKVGKDGNSKGKIVGKGTYTLNNYQYVKKDSKGSKNAKFPEKGKESSVSDENDIREKIDEDQMEGAVKDGAEKGDAKPSDDNDVTDPEDDEEEPY